VPGYEPFLLCDFHVHTRWSDGRLSIREVVDLYGRTGRFDVIAITDHILIERNRRGLAGRLLSLARRELFVTRERFDAYLADIAVERERAMRLYGLLVLPGVEVPQNHRSRKKSSPIIALNVQEHFNADQPAAAIVREIGRQGALSIECHPSRPTTTGLEIGTCFLWNNRQRLADLVDVGEAANRENRCPVTSPKPTRPVADGDFHQPAPLCLWETLLRCEKNWPAIAGTLRANVDIALTLYRHGSWATQP
jgi:hypothetical protein